MNILFIACRLTAWTKKKLQRLVVPADRQSEHLEDTGCKWIRYISAYQCFSELPKIVFFGRQKTCKSSAALPRHVGAPNWPQKVCQWKCSFRNPLHRPLRPDCLADVKGPASCGMGNATPPDTYSWHGANIHRLFACMFDTTCITLDLITFRLHLDYIIFHVHTHKTLRHLTLHHLPLQAHCNTLHAYMHIVYNG